MHVFKSDTGTKLASMGWTNLLLCFSYKILFM